MSISYNTKSITVTVNNCQKLCKINVDNNRNKEYTVINGKG